MNEELSRLGATICLTLIFLLSTASIARADGIQNKDQKNSTDVKYSGLYISPSDGQFHRYDFVVWLDPIPAKETNWGLDGVSEYGFWDLLGNFSSPASARHLDFDLIFSVLEGYAHYEVDRYDAGLSRGPGPSAGGIWSDSIMYDFRVDYVIDTHTDPFPAGWKIVWIQFVSTNFPMPGEGTMGSPSIAIDPYKLGGTPDFEDGLPFYFSESEMNSGTFHGQKIYERAAGIDATFYDAPTRPFSWLITHNLRSMYWEAYLFACYWNGTVPGQVYYNSVGIKWGFKIAWEDRGPAVPKGGLPWTNGGVAGDKYDYIPGDPLNGTTVTVGGYSSSLGKITLIDMFEVSSICLSIGSAAVSATVMVYKLKYHGTRKSKRH